MVMPFSVCLLILEKVSMKISSNLASKGNKLFNIKEAKKHQNRTKTATILARKQNASTIITNSNIATSHQIWR